MASDSRPTDARGVTATHSSSATWTATRRVLTAITAAGLGVDAYIHWHLAASFDTLVGASSPHISQGQLFRLEAVLALVAMVLVLATRRRFAALVALLIAAGGVGAVLAYGFVDIGSLGPLPDMYDPTWSTEKVVSVVAEGFAALGALGLLFLPRVNTRPDERALDD
jgi:cytochrome c oxidase assembly factor CtaG